MARAKAAIAAITPEPAITTPVTVPLDATYLSPHNPRQVVAVDEIAALAGSIATVGLLHPLIGHQDADGRVGITGGGRRWRALNLLAAGGWELCAPIDPQVRVTPDEATAIAWAGAEQEAHVALHPADEITAYAALRAQQVPPATIARTFAVTEAHVARRLALADLPEPVIANLRANKITLDIARALTLARSERRAVEVLGQVLNERWNAFQVRAALTQNAVRINDRRARFVGTEAYESAGGQVLRDLFEDRSYLSDEALLNRLFVEKGQSLAEELARDEGWSWSQFSIEEYWRAPGGDLRQIHPQTVELPEGDAERLEELAETDGLDEAEQAEMATLEARATAWTDDQRTSGGIIVSVTDDGTPLVRAYHRKADAGEGTGPTGAGGVSSKAKADKPLSDSLLADLGRIKLLSLQTALMGNASLMLDLLGWQLSIDAPIYQQPIALAPTRPMITPDKPEGTTVAEGLADPKHDYKAAGSIAAFAAWLQQPQEERIARLGRSLARLFHGLKDEIARTLADQLAVNIRDIWTPTAAGYFSRLTGPALDKLYVELTPADRADHKAFKAFKKKDKVEALDNLFGPQKHAWRAAMQLTPEEEARLDAWLPKELQWAPPAAAAEGPEPDPVEDDPDDEAPDDDDLGDEEPDDDEEDAA